MTIREITCQILSPYFDFQPFTYSREELDKLYQSVLIVINSLADPGKPVAGQCCNFCPASLICPSRRAETQRLAVHVEELPSGSDGARFLEMVTRVEVVCEEIRAHYKTQLETEPLSIPSWKLVSSTRRWIPRPQEALERLIEQHSMKQGTPSKVSFIEPMKVPEGDWLYEVKFDGLSGTGP
jgi:hypothetical protein